ncbi:MAG TPA: thioredoxin-like domain-containing protein [Rhodanobacteraceae bacterium]|nr:thioredoxin-like domain-containing protein [Rhodanobacteraceae bacterium]
MTTRAPAKEFPADLEWVNATRAPQLSELRGRVILLWFWTYDSVNCWSVVPDLRFLEDKYHDGLTVVGVHCPKYPQQVSGEGVLRAVNRLRLRHAVANDPGFRLWQEYGVDAWPSVVLIDAEGRLAAVFAGEGRRGEIDTAVGRLLEEAAMRDLRIYEPAPPALRPEPRLPLAFPGKLLADAKNVYVADSGHHRILECTHEGRVLRQFGSGNPGFSDGLQGEACFDDPQGLARWRDALIVADRGNHAVRRVSLVNGNIDTLIGRGRPGRMRPHEASVHETVLHSPSDLALVGDDLFVAVSGLHQIWRINLVTERVSMLAGSGQLALTDGSGGGAGFAQPSALGVLGRQLVVADAAASAIRWVHVDDGRVETAVGSGLYDYGDAAGGRGEARLQNPLGIAVDPRGIVFIADSYNNGIKVLNRKGGEVRSLRINYRFSEPAGLSLSSGVLWVANTNLHEVMRIDLNSGAAKHVGIGEA